MNRYEKYYADQAKSGIGGGYYPHQAGHGLGRLFGSIWRSVFPVLRSGFKAVKEELFNSGVGIIKDGFSSIPVKESLANRVRQFGTNLSDRASASIKNMAGSGKRSYKKRKSSTLPHCAVKKRRRQTRGASKRKKQKRRKIKKGVKRLRKGPKKTKRKKAPKRKRRKTAKRTKAFADIFG